MTIISFKSYVLLLCLLIAAGFAAFSMLPSEQKWQDALESSRDDDSDGIKNAIDNCPLNVNENQEDLNQNGIGDICENPVKGDANNDRQVTCVDLEITKNSLGKKINDSGFDFRADLNKDKIVDKNDEDIVRHAISTDIICH